MIVYPDTSVLVSLVAEDKHSLKAEQWLMTAPRLRISTWTLAEASSVLARKARQRLLTVGDHEVAERQLAVMTSSTRAIIQIIPSDIVDTRTLVRSSNNLRAPDALHLAIALRLSLDIATFDDGLVRAAKAAGCGLVDL